MDDILSEKDPLETGIVLFNEGRYFEAHEAWGVPWRVAADSKEKRFLQGLIMVAGAFHHYLRRECAGAAALLGKSLPLVRSGINAHPNVRLSELAGAIADLMDEFSSCSLRVSMDALPKIARMYIHC